MSRSPPKIDQTAAQVAKTAQNRWKRGFTGPKLP
jgi:hypothetical protein